MDGVGDLLKFGERIFQRLEAAEFVGLDQGCQTHFSSGAAWSKSILTRAGLHNRKFLF